MNMHCIHWGLGVGLFTKKYWKHTNLVTQYFPFMSCKTYELWPTYVKAANLESLGQTV